MLFDKKDERAGERVLYKTKPNMFLGCRKAVYGIVLLIIVFIVSPLVVRFIGKMQFYMISQIELPLTRYAAIALFVVILIIIVYIIWQFLKWYSLEYSLTDSRIIIKSGLLSTKKNYMPYSAIQDVNTSQGIIARLFDVGTVSVFSAYDNNLMKIEDVSKPSEVEEIIFSHMVGIRNFQEPPRNYIDRNDAGNYSENIPEEEYYDEYEPITPIGHEKNSTPRREYEYYPEDFSYREERVNRYEYEPYEDEVDHNMNRAINNSKDNIRFEGAPNTFSNDASYNEMRDDYSQGSEDSYQYAESVNHSNESSENIHQNKPEQVDEIKNSSETVIRRHFDKFKK